MKSVYKFFGLDGIYGLKDLLLPTFVTMIGVYLGLLVNDWQESRKDNQLTEQMVSITNQVDFFEEYQSEDTLSLNHSRIINRIIVALSRYDDEYEVFPELELELPTGKCKPDVAIYKNLPTDWFNDIMYFNQAPIIAVEVLSPKQAVTDLTDKALKQYFPAGVQVVWIVIPTTRIMQILLPDGSIQTWASGILRDPVTNLEVDLGYLFK